VKLTSKGIGSPSQFGEDMISKTQDNRRLNSNEVTLSNLVKPSSRDSNSGYRSNFPEANPKTSKVIHNGKLILNQIGQQQQSRMQSQLQRKNTITPNNFAHSYDE
jgi:hypothetical protein